jgi:hypothetical protein
VVHRKGWHRIWDSHRGAVQSASMPGHPSVSHLAPGLPDWLARGEDHELEEALQRTTHPPAHAFVQQKQRGSFEGPGALLARRKDGATRVPLDGRALSEPLSEGTFVTDSCPRPPYRK